MGRDQDNSRHPLEQFFEYQHLPPRLAEVSARFTAVADWMLDNLPAGEQRDAALQKLLEAKDCAVRARLFRADWQPKA